MSKSLNFYEVRKQRLRMSMISLSHTERKHVFDCLSHWRIDRWWSALICGRTPIVKCLILVSPQRLSTWTSLSILLIYAVRPIVNPIRLPSVLSSWVVHGLFTNQCLLTRPWEMLFFHLASTIFIHWRLSVIEGLTLWRHWSHSHRIYAWRTDWITFLNMLSIKPIWRGRKLLLAIQLIRVIRISNAAATTVTRAMVKKVRPFLQQHQTNCITIVVWFWRQSAIVNV